MAGGLKDTWRSMRVELLCNRSGRNSSVPVCPARAGLSRTSVSVISSRGVRKLIQEAVWNRVSDTRAWDRSWPVAQVGVLGR